MQLNLNNFYNIVFGDALSKYSISDRSSFNAQDFSNNGNQYPIFINQIHGTEGLIIKSLKQAQNYEQFSFNGDFILTNVTGVMLGVLTADCLPVTVYDSKNNVIGIAHAGWRGSVAGIIDQMIVGLEKEYNSLITDLSFTFGPCAKVCCYEVDQLFVDNIILNYGGEASVIVRNNKYYFNLIEYNFLQLKKAGVHSSSIDINSNLCTICNESFHSYRRNKTISRQVTAISLK